MKDIPNFEGIYAITEDGRIWTYTKICGRGKGFLAKERWLKLKNTQFGYKSTTLFAHGKKSYPFVHRLVAQTYIPNPQNKPFINHKNGIKTDNRVENLEWVDAFENMQHAVRMGLMDPRDGENHNQAVLTWKKVDKIRNLYRNGKRICEIARIMGHSQSLMSCVVNNKTWVKKEPVI